jgi:hypothetical protein
VPADPYNKPEVVGLAQLTPKAKVKVDEEVVAILTPSLAFNVTVPDPSVLLALLSLSKDLITHTLSFSESCDIVAIASKPLSVTTV